VIFFTLRRLHIFSNHKIWLIPHFIIEIKKIAITKGEQLILSEMYSQVSGGCRWPSGRLQSETLSPIHHLTWISTHLGMMDDCHVGAMTSIFIICVVYKMTLSLVCCGSDN